MRRACFCFVPCIHAYVSGGWIVHVGGRAPRPASHPHPPTNPNQPPSPHQIKQLLAKKLRAVWEPFGALGRVYVASEGINAQMAVPATVFDNFAAACE